MEHLSIAMEQYLETVHDLSAGGAGGCRMSDVATRLQVSKASVNSALNVLASKGLVENEKYRAVRLTPQGMELAKLLARKHALIHALLTQVVGVDSSLADQDACAIEHVISSETVRQIALFLDSRTEKSGH